VAVTQAFSAVVSGTGNLTPSLPSHAVNDILVVALATEDNTATLSAPAGWTQIPATQPNSTGMRLCAWWRRATQTGTANPLLSKSTGTGASVALAASFGGVRTTGNPWDATPVAQANASSVTVAFGGGMTVNDQAMIVMLVSNTTDTNTAQTSAYRAATDPVQANWTERADTNSNTASGAGIAAATAIKTGTGATGSLNATLATASVNCGIAFELVPLPITFVPKTGGASAALSAGAQDSFVQTLDTGGGAAGAVTGGGAQVTSRETGGGALGTLVGGSDKLAQKTGGGGSLSTTVGGGVEAVASGKTGGALAALATGGTAIRVQAFPKTGGGTVGVSVYTRDSFTDTAGKLLTAHTEAPWTMHPASAGDGIITNANRLRHNGASVIGLLFVDLPSPSADYDVVATFCPQTNIGGALTGIVGRLDRTVNTLYLARYSGSGSVWQILKIVNGSATTLVSSASFPLTAGLFYDARLVLRNAYKALEINGVEVCRTTDNAITGVGVGGVRLFDSSQNQDATSMHLDNFAVTSPAPAGAVAGGGKIVQVAHAGGGAGVASTGGPKTVARVETGGASSTTSTGGPKATSRAETGGAASTAITGGPKTSRRTATGGALTSASTGGPKLVGAPKTGGGLSGAATGGSKLVGAPKTGGALTGASAGGARGTVRVYTGGALAAMTVGGSGARTRVATGGASSVAVAGGSRASSSGVSKTGGGLTTAGAGGPKLTQLAHSGGVFGATTAGGPKAVSRVASGGVAGVARSGGPKAIRRAGSGGATSSTGAGGSGVVGLVLPRAGGALAAGGAGGGSARVLARSGGGSSTTAGGGSKAITYSSGGRGPMPTQFGASGGLVVPSAGGARLARATKMGAGVAETLAGGSLAQVQAVSGGAVTEGAAGGFSRSKDFPKTGGASISFTGGGVWNMYAYRPLVGELTADVVVHAATAVVAEHVASAELEGHVATADVIPHAATAQGE